MTKQFYKIDAYTELCCVVGTTYAMEEADLEKFAEDQGWTLEEIPVPDYVDVDNIDDMAEY